MRILYVEDNPANVSLVKRVAREHELTNYIDGEEALRNFAKDNPELVLMDIQLTGRLSGLDVVRELRQQGYTVPIIAVTAYAMIGDRERCLAAGCDDYMAKPLPIPDLLRLFERRKQELAELAAATLVASGTPEVKAETPIVVDTKPVTSPTPEVKAETPVVADVKPVTPPTPEVKTETPVVADVKPVTPPITEVKAETPVVADVKPVTPPTIEAKTETPVVGDVKPVTPEVKAETPIVVETTPPTPEVKVETPIVVETKPIISPTPEVKDETLVVEDEETRPIIPLTPEVKVETPVVADIPKSDDNPQ